MSPTRTHEDRWTAVDTYLEEQLIGVDGVLDATLQSSEAAGLPAIAVSPAQGKLLFVLASAIGARNILELGTLGGYSAIWLARALPDDGKLVTIEFERRHADVARRNFERAGVSAKIDVRHGAALDVLPLISAEKLPPFDLVFIDADKVNYPRYLEWAIQLTREGGLIIADNVVRDGAVADASSTDPAVLAVREYLGAISQDRRVTATAIQTVGVKGYDGLAIAMVTRQHRS